MTVNTPEPARPWTSRDFVALTGLILATLALYARTRHFGFVNYDDHLYISDNPQLTRGITLQTLHWALTAIAGASYWHPLTLLTELFLAAMFGTHPGPFHVLNFLLHAANVGLLFVFLRNATGRYWPAVITAALWGFHPLRVESVVWISELKDVLCGAVWLSCMLAYLAFARQRTVRRYLLVFFLNALALFAKPMAMTLPAVLLLLDYWPLHAAPLSFGSWKKWRWLALEKFPLLLTAAAVASYSYFEQVPDPTRPPFLIRAQNASTAFAVYFRDCFYPGRLAFFYPHQGMIVGGRFSIPAVIAGVLLAIGMTCIAWIFHGRKPYLLTGWLWFFGMLLPVLGLIPEGEQARADRYTYLPSVGLTLAVVWLSADLISRNTASRTIGGTVAAAAAIVLAVSTCVYVGYWRDTVTLFGHADAVTTNNYMARSVLAYQYREDGDVQRALRLSAEAIALSPNSPYPRYSYGFALFDAGRYEEAANAFTMPVMSDVSWYSLGLTRAAQAKQCLLDSKPGEVAFRNMACDCFRAALKKNRDYAAAEDKLADQTARLNHLPRAIEIWQDLLRRTPTYGPAHGNLGDALRITGDIRGATEQYGLAYANGERDPYWEMNLAYLTATNPQAAAADVQEMIPVANDAVDRTHGQDPAAFDALAACLARVGRFDAAIAAAETAIAQANLQGNASLVQDIKARLRLYQRGQASVSGSN